MEANLCFQNYQRLGTGEAVRAASASVGWSFRRAWFFHGKARRQNCPGPRSGRARPPATGAEQRAPTDRGPNYIPPSSFPDRPHRSDSLPETSPCWPRRRRASRCFTAAQASQMSTSAGHYPNEVLIQAGSVMLGYLKGCDAAKILHSVCDP